MCAGHNDELQNSRIKSLENFLLVLGRNIRKKKWHMGEMGRDLVGKGRNGHWAKWESWRRGLLGEMKNERK